MKPLGEAAIAVTASKQHLTDTSRALNEKRAETTKYARLLLGCYRTGDANDPEVYTAGVIAVLSSYPMEIIRLVCDPRRGIPSKVKWLPTLAEIKAECEAWHAPMRELASRNESIKQQLEEREHLEAEQVRRPTFEELQAKYGKTWGLNPRPEEIAIDENRQRKVIDRNLRDIQAEYAAHGEEPIKVGELLVSRELVQIIRGQ